MVRRDLTGCPFLPPSTTLPECLTARREPGSLSRARLWSDLVTLRPPKLLPRLWNAVRRNYNYLQQPQKEHRSNPIRIVAMARVVRGTIVITTARMNGRRCFATCVRS